MSYTTKLQIHFHNQVVQRHFGAAVADCFQESIRSNMLCDNTAFDFCQLHYT